jgi:DNA invertase Pin-like site-specific DNA recombinase
MNYLYSVPAQATRPLRAAVYGRASRDPRYRGRSIKDQFAECRAECNERGWEIVDFYEDRDRSASSRATKVRDEYERMVEDVRAGKIDVIVYAERSRTNRTLDGYVRLRALCMETGVLWCYDGRVYDLTKASDRRETARDAVESEGEGDTIIARNVRTARLSAQRGWMTGTPPFGFKRVYDPDTGELLGQVAHPDEAPVLVKLFNMADQKISIKRLVAFMLPRRPLMTDQGIRAILQNRAYIGIRVHHDTEYPAAWKGLVDEDVFWRVQRMLDDPDRRTTHTTGVEHLLSGIALCSLCRADVDIRNSTMTVRLAQPKYRRGALYRCRVEHLSIMKQLLEAYVEEALLQWLSSEKAAAAMRRQASSGELERERAKLKAITEQLRDARARATEFDPVTGLPGLTVASLAELEQRLIPLARASEAIVKGLLSVGDPLLDRLIGMDPDALDEMWNDEEELVLEQKRHVIRKVLRVEVLPALRKGHGQPVGPRVNLIFFGQPGFEEWPKVLEPVAT